MNVSSPDIDDAQGVRDGPEHQGLQGVAGTACGLDLLPGGGAEGMRVQGQRLGDVPVGEDLDRVGARCEALYLEGTRASPQHWHRSAPRIAHVHRLLLVREFSNGIDFFICGPRSFRIRM